MRMGRSLPRLIESKTWLLPESLFSLRNKCCNVLSDPILFEMLPDRKFEERLITSILLKAHIGSKVPDTHDAHDAIVRVRAAREQ